MMKGDENELLDAAAPVLTRHIEDEDCQKYVACTHAKYCLNKLWNFYQQSVLADVILVVENFRIPAHRVVLASSSEYFFAMFNNKLRESSELEIPMGGVDGQSIKTLVDFFYSGEIIIHEDIVENLLRTACMLQLSNVVDACTEFLKFRLHPSNCIGLRNFAEEQSCSSLQESAEKFIMDNFAEVVCHQEFLELSIDDVEMLLSSNDINVTSEEMVYETMNSWINYKREERECHSSRLLSLIKLPLLSPEFIADKIINNPLFGKCYDLVLEALNYHLLPERRAMLQSPRTRPRNSTVGTLIMIGGMDGYKGSLQMDQYDLRTDTWSQFGNMNGRRLQFGAAVIDDKIYVVGGREGLKTLNIVECYNPKTKTWKPMPSMTNQRHGLGVAVLEGPMYAVGGHDGWSYLSTVERWDPSNLQWSYVAPMNTQRCTAGVAVLKNKLYAVGGRDGSSCLKSVECFDPHTNKWNYCTQMAKRRGGAGVGVINGYLFAIGGHDAPILNSSMYRYESVERFDPQTGQWTMVASMSVGRDSIGVCVLGDKIIAVGGYDGQSYLQIVEAYDPQENKWLEAQPLSSGRAGMSVLVLKNL